MREEIIQSRTARTPPMRAPLGLPLSNSVIHDFIAVSVFQKYDLSTKSTTCVKILVTSHIKCVVVFEIGSEIPETEIGSEIPETARTPPMRVPSGLPLSNPSVPSFLLSSLELGDTKVYGP